MASTAAGEPDSLMELSRLLRNCGMRVGNFRRIEALLYLIESFIKIFARKFLKKPAELSTGFKSIHSNDIQRDLSGALPKTRSTAKPYSKDNLASTGARQSNISGTSWKFGEVSPIDDWPASLSTSTWPDRPTHFISSPSPSSKCGAQMTHVRNLGISTRLVSENCRCHTRSCELTAHGVYRIAFDGRCYIGVHVPTAVDRVLVWIVFCEEVPVQVDRIWAEESKNGPVTLAGVRHDTLPFVIDGELKVSWSFAPGHSEPVFDSQHCH